MASSKNLLLLLLYTFIGHSSITYYSPNGVSTLMYMCYVHTIESTWLKSSRLLKYHRVNLSAIKQRSCWPLDVYTVTQSIVDVCHLEMRTLLCLARVCFIVRVAQSVVGGVILGLYWRPNTVCHTLSRGAAPYIPPSYYNLMSIVCTTL
jgi:hypothetical protein